MPIKDIQRRQTQVGRIRAGYSVETGKKDRHGNPVRRPAKLEVFRFTSPSKALIEQVAGIYGGDPAEWEPQGGGAKQWEVYTKAESLPVVVPPNSVSQWYEAWAGGACIRRCDGAREMLKDQPCQCLPEPAERLCNPTTRIALMLADVPGIGVWTLESHGYYAATELPAVAELLAAAGGYVPARLELEERSARRPKASGEGMETRRWMVPVLHVDARPAELLALTGAAPAAAIEAAPMPAIMAIPDDELASVVPELLLMIEAAADIDSLRDVWKGLGDSGIKLDADKKEQVSKAFWTKSKQLSGRDQTELGTEATPPDVQETEPNREETWTKILRLAGERGWNVPVTSQRFRDETGKDVTDADGWAMQLFLDAMVAGEVQ